MHKNHHTIAAQWYVLRILMELFYLDKQKTTRQKIGHFKMKTSLSPIIKQFGRLLSKTIMELAVNVLQERKKNETKPVQTRFSN